MMQKSEFDWVSEKIFPSKNDHIMWLFFFYSVGRRIHKAKMEIGILTVLCWVSYLNCKL